jgi:hypothetical protein
MIPAGYTPAPEKPIHPANEDYWVMDTIGPSYFDVTVENTQMHGFRCINLTMNVVTATLIYQNAPRDNLVVNHLN